MIMGGGCGVSAELAHVDPAALVTPPRGLEMEYVPIALFEGPNRSKNCVGV